jgi:hypothetical protein
MKGYAGVKEWTGHGDPNYDLAGVQGRWEYDLAGVRGRWENDDGSVVIRQALSILLVHLLYIHV